MRFPSLCALLAGALAMSGAAAEEPKTLTEGDVTYDTKVTVKVWDAGGKQFFDPVKNQWAKRIDKRDNKGKPVIIFQVRGGARNTLPGPKSIITDAAGNEFTVIEGEHVCRVQLTKQAEPKKP